MNIRLSNSALRIRLSKMDVAALASGGDVSLIFAPVPGPTLCFRLKLADDQSENLKLTYDDSVSILWIAKHAFLDLEQRLPSREGIQEQGVNAQNQAYTLILEVDLRK